MNEHQLPTILALGLESQDPEPLARVLKQILEGYETRKVAQGSLTHIGFPAE